MSNFETKSYIAGGMIRRFKVSLSNPRDFKAGDKYIVVGSSTHFQTVTDEKNARKLNESIMNADNIRRAYE